MNFKIVTFFSFLLANCINAQEPIHIFYFVGDAGNDTVLNKTLLNLQVELEKNDNSTVVFLGDNIYPDGLEKGVVSKKKLKTQLDVLKNYKGNVFFTPGNHDWKAGKWNGLKSIRLQSKFVEDYLNTTSIKNKEGINFCPNPGMPGPYSESFFGIRILAMDLQWWFQKQIFHPTGEAETRKATKQFFFNTLDSLLRIANEQREQVILFAHHPLFSNGHHGKKKQPIRFLINYTPLQLFGLLGLNRTLSQDIYNPKYKRLRKRMLSIIEKYNNCLYVSGHDHNLQYLKVNNNHYIVSGSGSKLSKLHEGEHTLLYGNDKERGFFKLEIYENNKRVLIPYLENKGKQESILLN